MSPNTFQQTVPTGTGPAERRRMRRRAPRVSELRPLLQFAPPRLDRTQARLDKAMDLGDVRRIAQRVTPAGPFDYVDGGANYEDALRRNWAAYRQLELRPQVLRPVGDVDLSVDIMGARADMPIGIAPTGFTRMMHAEGEVGGARAAGRHGIPFALSTMGTTSIEDLAAAAPDTRRWFQLYLWKDRREDCIGLVERAHAAGYDTLLVTVDTATGGLRHRDARNGMTIPPTLTLKTVLDASYRPRWWWDFLTTEPLTFASLTNDTAATPTVIASMFDPTLSLEDLDWIRGHWPGTLVVKGIQTAEDARLVVDHGVDGVYLSNHGGRQLDRAPVPLRELPAIRAAVGPDVPIVLDSGITSGTDVVAAMALGASFTMVGRAYLYGLMAGGERGVDRVLDILRREMQVTMQLLGVRSVAELRAEHVRLDHRG